MDETHDPSPRSPACPHCGCPDLYMRKDFPPALGCGIVAMAIGAFFVLAAWQRMIMWGFVVLLVAAGLDAIVYVLVGTVAVCYRCARPVRGPMYKGSIGPFNLSIAEKYRQAGDDHL